MITGTLLPSRIVSNTSKPSISGIMTSNKIKSGVTSRNLWMACLPLKASATWKPSCSKFMRIKRTMRSSSSTTRMRRRSKSSGMLFPHKADQVFFLGALQNFDQGDLPHGPDHLDYILLKIVNILAITQAGITDNDNGVGKLR